MRAQATQTTDTQAYLQPDEILKKTGDLPDKAKKFLEMTKELGLRNSFDSVTDAGVSLMRLPSNEPIPSLELTIGSNKLYIRAGLSDKNDICIQSFDCLRNERIFVSIKGPDHNAVRYLSLGEVYFIGDDILSNPQFHNSLERPIMRRLIGDEVSVVGDFLERAIEVFGVSNK